MPKKTKPVRICVEGATADKRVVQREWLTEIAENYDKEAYGARINMEHWNYPWAPRFGDVESVFTKEVDEGKLKGKLALYAVLSPTDELVEMNHKRQKVYTSVEINPNFSDFGSAYLVGLAVTDNPASLGTDMLHFSQDGKENPLNERKQSPENIFTCAVETLLELEDEEKSESKPKLFSRISDIFKAKQKDSDEHLADVYRSIELCAREIEAERLAVGELKAELTQIKESLSQKDNSTKLTEYCSKLDELIESLNKQDGNKSTRPASLGNENSPAVELQTNC